jgi:hypothetical protein
MTVEELMEKLREVKNPEDTEVLVMTPYKVFLLEVKDVEVKQVWSGGMIKLDEDTVILNAFDPG